MGHQATGRNASKLSQKSRNNGLPTLPTFLQPIEIIGCQKLPTYLPTLPTYL